MRNIATIDAQLVTKIDILVVDDRPEGLLALEAVLSGDHYQLIKASSGREALHYALFHDFAVILLDVQMPEMDGFETARLLRENFRSKETPIIFVTAISKEMRHINEGYENGAVDYIFKPLDPFVLKSKVDIFADLFKKNLKIKEQAELLRKMELQEKDRQLAEIRQEGVRNYISLANAVPHLILKLNTDRKIEYFNQHWKEYTGFHAEVEWDDVIHPQDRKRVLSLWLRMNHQNAHVSQMEIRLRRGTDGSYCWHLVRVVAEMKNNQITGWICTCTDIDIIKKTEERFRLLSQELNQSNKQLEEFAYVASHDLKEPLHVISSFVYLLERRLQVKLGDQERDYFNFIKQGVTQAQTLIRELLEYSCIGKEKTLEVVSLSSVVVEVCNNLKFLIEESKSVITHEALPQVKANHLEMVQLFQNLIANSIKYRNEKPLEVSISVESQDDMWVFAVKDNGIGIEPQFHERIFGMFQKLHPKSKYSGVGIGLAICKRIVENYGGKIWVKSKISEGSTFYFSMKKEI